MNKNTQLTILSSVISASREINEHIWLLSYLRRKGKDHAFFVLEGVMEGRRSTQVIQLLPRDEPNYAKAKVDYRNIDFENFAELIQICTGCEVISYDIPRADAEIFLDIVLAERARGEYGLIQYVKMADAKSSGSIASSLEASASDVALVASREFVMASQDKLAQALAKVPEDSLRRYRLQAKHLVNEYLLTLISYGHNSCTWANLILKTLKIPMSVFEPLIMNPAIMQEYQQSQQNEEQSNSTFRCSIL